MAVRNRIPTIFNIYMVDVLCCALGCVILLWQVSFREAESQTERAHARGDALQTSLDQLKDAQLSLRSLNSEVDNLKIALDATKKKEVQVTLLLDDTRKSLDAAEKLALVRKKDYDALKETHELAQAVLDKLRAQFKDLEAKSSLSGADLAEKIKANAALAAKLSDLERVASLLGKEKLDALAKLKNADLRLQLLEDSSTDAQKRIADLLRDKEAMNLRMTISVKDAELLQAAMAKMSAENLDTIRRAKLVEAAAQNRFAGITLTGKKVVFLVDMSGSMELTDEATADPDKWPTVCDTLARILQSLLDVTDYQVILFSDKIRYPLGNEGKWIPVRERVQDAKAIAAQLKQIKPEGPTNMYAAFEEAFRFRAQGLDTIYVLSDGLPNAGPGLPVTNVKLDDAAITTALAKHLRGKLKNDWNKSAANAPRVRINTIGFFYESPDVGAFLWALSREHDGSFVGLR